MSDWISERCLHNVTGDGDYICGRFGETPSRCSSSTISMTLEYSFFFLLHSEPCPFLLAFSLFLFFIFMKSKMRFGPVSAEVALSATIYIRVSFACMGNNIHFFFSYAPSENQGGLCGRLVGSFATIPKTKSKQMKLDEDNSRNMFH